MGGLLSLRPPRGRIRVATTLACSHADSWARLPSLRAHAARWGRADDRAAPGSLRSPASMLHRITGAALAILIVATAGLLGPPGARPSDDRAEGVTHAQSSLPPLPAGWPSTLQLGLSDSPGGAAGLKQRAPFGFRYQYLAA